jgi:predicted Zn-dependent peptidase
MGGESTMARAAALAGDLFRRGHVRTLAEVVATVDRLTLQQVNDHAAQALDPKRINEGALAVVGSEPL